MLRRDERASQRRRVSVLPLATLLCCVPLALVAGERQGGVAAAERAAIETVVLQTHDAILQAARELKADANLEFMLDTDAGALVSGGQLLLTRAQATDSIRGLYVGLKGQQITVARRHVNVLAPTVAVLVAEVEGVATTLDGRNLSGRSLQTVVFALRDGRWKVAHAHQSAAR